MLKYRQKVYTKKEHIHTYYISTQHKPDVAVADAVVRPPSSVDEANSSAKNVVQAALGLCCRDVVRRRCRHNLIKCSERICN